MSKRRYADDQNNSDDLINSETKRGSKDERNSEYHSSSDRYNKGRNEYDRNNRSSRNDRRYESDRYDADRPRRRKEYDDYDDRRPSRRREYPKRENDEDESDRNGRPSWDNIRVKRHAEMIQERKLLWKGGNAGMDGKSSEGAECDNEEFGPRLHSSPSSSSGNKPETSEKKLENKWTSMIAASAKDTSQMDKFQRLMGLKKNSDKEKDPEKSSSDPEKQVPEHDANELEKERIKQLELQRKLDVQYETARHTQFSRRGKGLGSF